MRLNTINSFIFVYLYSLMCLMFVRICAEKDKNGQTEKENSQKFDVDSIRLYRRLLKQKRGEQLQAVRQIQGIEDYEKQHKLVEMMLQNLFKVLGNSQVVLMGSGFVPGDAFPLGEIQREAFSMIAENTAFLGDLVLRVPDITRKLLKGNPDWIIATKWSIGFMNESKIYEARESKLLNLMSQELGIIPRDPDYVNPFKQEIEMAEKQSHMDAVAAELLRKQEKEKKKKEKREKKRKERGPRLSGGRNEL